MQIKIGNWVGGAADEASGTVEWAGGYTNLTEAPFTMYVKSITIQDYTTCATSYSYGDMTGSFDSIVVHTNSSAASDTSCTAASGATEVASDSTSTSASKASSTTKAKASGSSTSVAASASASSSSSDVEASSNSSSSSVTSSSSSTTSGAVAVASSTSVGSVNGAAGSASPLGSMVTALGLGFGIVVMCL